MNEKLRTGTKLLSAAFIVGIVWTVVLLSVPLSEMFHNGSLRFYMARSYLSLALSVSSAILLIAGWTVLHPVAPTRTLPFLNAAVGFPIFRLMFTALSRIHPSRGPLVSSVWMLSFVGGMLAVWLALRALGADRVPRPADATGLVITALVIGTLIGVVQEWEMTKKDHFFFSSSTYIGMSVLDHLMSLLLYALFLSRARALSTSKLASEVATDDVAVPLMAPPLAPASSGNDLVVGSIWLVGGLVVTGVSFSLAQGGGGHYLVTTGAIAYGLVRVIRGLSRR